MQLRPNQLPATIYENNEITCGNSYSTLWSWKCVATLGPFCFVNVESVDGILRMRLAVNDPFRTQVSRI